MSNFVVIFGIIGVLLLLSLVIILCICLLRRIRKRSPDEFEDPTDVICINSMPITANHTLSSCNTPITDTTSPSPTFIPKDNTLTPNTPISPSPTSIPIDDSLTPNTPISPSPTTIPNDNTIAYISEAAVLLVIILIIANIFLFIVYQHLLYLQH